MMFKVIIDFDGALTAAEEQVGPLAELALHTLADEILLEQTHGGDLSNR